MENLIGIEKKKVRKLMRMKFLRGEIHANLGEPSNPKLIF